MSKILIREVANSPFGSVEVVLEGNVFLELKFVQKPACCTKATQELADKVFRGESVEYKLLGTDFQLSVWEELLKIPRGETSTYERVANAIKRPNAYRAVGTAIGKNPLNYIVPCHRVIRKNGELGGFAGGLEVKEKLLKKEAQS